MFKNNIIEKRVMAVVKKRIEDAQKIYDDQTKELENNHKISIENLKAKLENDKISVADKLVNEIFLVK